MYTHGVRIQLDVAVRQPCPQTFVRAFAHVPIKPPDELQLKRVELSCRQLEVNCSNTDVYTRCPDPT